MAWHILFQFPFPSLPQVRLCTKLRNRTPKSTAGTIPKAALKAVWLKTKEQARTAARENDTGPRQQEPTDLAGSAAEQSAAFGRCTDPAS